MDDVFSEYQYSLPQNLIAHTPPKDRDMARLFVYDTQRDRITFDIFKNVAQFLPKNSVTVLNTTKVLPARVDAITERGIRTQLLFLVN